MLEWAASISLPSEYFFYFRGKEKKIDEILSFFKKKNA